MAACLHVQDVYWTSSAGTRPTEFPELGITHPGVVCRHQGRIKVPWRLFDAAASKAAFSSDSKAREILRPAESFNASSHFTRTRIESPCQRGRRDPTRPVPITGARPTQPSGLPNMQYRRRSSSKSVERSAASMPGSSVRSTGIPNEAVIASSRPPRFGCCIV